MLRMKIAPINLIDTIWGKVSKWDFRAVSLARVCVLAFLLVFPFQIRTMIFGEMVYFEGGFNIYRVGFLYLGDIFLVVALLLYGWAFFKREIELDTKKDLRLDILLVSFVVILFGTVFLAEEKDVAVVHCLRIMMLGIAYFLLSSGIVKRKAIINLLAVGILIQGLLAIFQFIFQSSIGFPFLGESAIDSAIKGVAKIDISGGKLIRSYGTFSHPNVLSGFLVVGLWLIVSLIKEQRWIIPIVVILSMALVFTFSRSAFIGLIGGGLTYFAVVQRKIDWKYPILIISVFVFVVTAFNLNGTLFERVLTNDESISERVEYMLISKRMAFDNPLGVGVGNFTVKMQDYSSAKLAPWEFQPVHSVYLMVLNELGFIGLFVFLGIFVLIFTRLLHVDLLKDEHEKDMGYLLIGCTVSVLIISMFDHYFWTLYSGQVVFIIYLSLASSFLSTFKLPERKS